MAEKLFNRVGFDFHPHPEREIDHRIADAGFAIYRGMLTFGILLYNNNNSIGRNNRLLIIENFYSGMTRIIDDFLKDCWT